MILGGDGMLGHTLFTYLARFHEVRVTLRRDLAEYLHLKLFSEFTAYSGIDVRSLGSLLEVLVDFRPEAVVNCVGIVKQRTMAQEIIPSLEINALFPHRLALICKAIGSRLVHLSTDCVFSGKKGNYHETDLSDAEDLYGKSKFLGELNDRHCFTMRTSLIGRELSRRLGLVEWLLAQEGTSIKGFKNAIFSGFTTLELSRIINTMLTKYPEASGVYHVSSDPISKFDLLMLIKEKMGLSVEIIPDETFRCDRSLDSTRFRREFNYHPPAWPEMVDDLTKDVSVERS